MMDFIFINIMESAFMLAIFYLYYEFILKKETFFKMNRVYLLSSLLFSVTIPFLSFSVHVFDNPNINSGIFQSLRGIKSGYNELNAVIIYAYSGKLTWTLIKDYISFIYLIGALISMVFFILGFIKILLLIRQSRPKKYGRYRIVETKEAIFPFSLFKWIIINPEKYSSEDMEQIIVHEKIHAFQLHSLDLIMIEVLVILFWFNPFIYWYRKSIREVHEYLADQAVVENGFDRLDYQKLLFSQVSGGRFVGLSSRFSYSLSKNRLKMLTMMKSKNISKIKIALAIPLAVVAVILFANPVEFVKANTGMQTRKGFISIQDTTVNLQKNTETVDGNGQIKVFNDDQLEELVYFTAEEMPKFKGQDVDAFRFFIQENLKYPIEAKKEGVQGRVYIQFDIDKDGKLVNAKVVRGVHPSLDNEALRVTNLSPKWEPAMDKGENVRTRFTFPIIFALN